MGVISQDRGYLLARGREASWEGELPGSELTTCFYCHARLSVEELFLYWMGSSSVIRLHADCAEAFSRQLMDDVKVIREERLNRMRRLATLEREEAERNSF